MDRSPKPDYGLGRGHLESERIEAVDRPGARPV
jgi:hypothetical protein